MTGVVWPVDLDHNAGREDLLIADQIGGKNRLQLDDLLMGMNQGRVENVLHTFEVMCLHAN